MVDHEPVRFESRRGRARLRRDLPLERGIVDRRGVVVGPGVLGMADLAVPALPVVLPHQLPVRAHLVAPRGRDPGALEALGREVRAERVPGAVERYRVVGETHEDQPADLARVDAAQIEVTAVEVAVGVHAPARQQRAVARVGPLVVRAHEPRDVAGGGRAELHAAVATRVVECVNHSVVAAHDDDRVGVDVEDDVVARPLHLAAVAGEEPSATPDALEVEPVDSRIGLEFAREREAGLVLGEQSVEQRLGVGELRRLERPARHRAPL